MINITAPMDRLSFFQEKLGLCDGDRDALLSRSDLFLPRREEFVELLWEFLSSMDESRRILELMEPHGGLRRNWLAWYTRLFSEGVGDGFRDLLWQSGLKHVTRNVDQRFIHLGYCFARLFLHRVVDEALSADEAQPISRALDRVLDLCLMVATDAFLAGTTQCDREVINGIAHQVRNPVMVIGGFVRNLEKRIVDGRDRSALDAIGQEAKRLEAMVRDVGVFIELDQREAVFLPCSLDGVIAAALGRVKAEGWPEATRWEANIDPRYPTVVTDRGLLGELLYHLLQNSVEAVHDAEDRQILVATRGDGALGRVLTLEIFNTGRVPSSDEVHHLFSPFYSSKPTGSGFGLPIAALVAKKLHAEIDLVPLPGEGTRTLVTLPLLDA